MTQNPPKIADLAQKIDHTLLKPTLNFGDLKKLCEEAAQFGFKTVCIPPVWVKESCGLLKHSPVKTITVVGFPLGYSTFRSKAFEASEAISNGASEIDMVVNLSFLKSGRLQEVEADIGEVVKACGNIPVKVIIETAYLSKEEKVTLAQIAEAKGAAFVKTSTGFATPGEGTAIGATVADIALLRHTLKPATKIKASGGIRNLADAMAMIAAGADRLGTSSGVALIKGLETSGGY